MFLFYRHTPSYSAQLLCFKLKIHDLEITDPRSQCLETLNTAVD